MYYPGDLILYDDADYSIRNTRCYCVIYCTNYGDLLDKVNFYRVLNCSNGQLEYIPCSHMLSKIT